MNKLTMGGIGLWGKLFGLSIVCLISTPRLRADDPRPLDRSAPKCECEAATRGCLTSKRYTREVAIYRLPEVTLIDANGERTSASDAIDIKGPVILQFVFTTCPTICGPLSSTLATARQTLGDDITRATFISISIDPEHDRPAQLRRYAKSLNAGDRWHFYTGSLEEISAVQKAFDAFQVNKMGHQPLTFLRPKQGAPWVRLTGMLSAADLAAEYRAMVQP